MQSKKPYSGLVLAARRPGILDLLAKNAGVTHKCLVPINGRPMLERVIEAVLQSGRCRHVYVAIDEPGVLQSNPKIAGWLADGSVSTVAARSTLTDSVFAAADGIPDQNWPIMITTADNAGVLASVSAAPSIVQSRWPSRSKSTTWKVKRPSTVA